MSAAERELRTALKKSLRRTKKKPCAVDADDTVKQPPEDSALSASQVGSDGTHSAAQGETDSALGEARADDCANPEHVSDAAITEREPSAKLISWRPLRRNTLRGFASVRFPSGLEIYQIPVHVSGGHAWASPPGRASVDTNGSAIRDPRGKVKFQPVIGFASPAGTQPAEKGRVL